MLKTKVAGVMFMNASENGGKSRQEILQELCNTKGCIITVDLKHVAFHNPETNENEPAIQCIEHATKHLIGWIPRTDIAMMNGCRQMTGFIRLSKKRYSVQLEEQIAPSPAQYRMVKEFCQKHNMQMPAYDRRAYTQIFAMLHN